MELKVKISQPLLLWFWQFLFSHASSVPLGNAMSLYPTVGPPLWSRLKYPNNHWMDAIKLFTDIHGPQRMNPSDLSDPLSLPPTTPTTRLTFVFSEIASEILDDLPWNLVQTKFVLIMYCRYKTHCRERSHHLDPQSHLSQCLSSLSSAITKLLHTTI